MADTPTPTEKKIDELYELIAGIDIALMTTRRADGLLVTRPMDTQPRDRIADLWFATDVGAHKTEELEQDPNVNLGYYDPGSKEWVSVSGRATVSQDREQIRRLYQPDWKVWFSDEGGDRDGGPDDPRIALILVDVQAAHYQKARYPRPVALFEIARGLVTGEAPELGREEDVAGSDLS